MTEMRTMVPPIKCQGIKTKLIPFILDSLIINGDSLEIVKSFKDNHSCIISALNYTAC